MDGKRPDVTGLTAPTLLDAVLERHGGHRADIPGLVGVVPGRVVWGPAATMMYGSRRTDRFDPVRDSFAARFYEAVGDAPAGSVLVMASGGNPGISLGGGTKLSRLHNHRMSGLVCDGSLRDWDELAAYDFGTYCIAQTPAPGDEIVAPLAVNVPVAVNGTTVLPGDWVLADEHGVVVVPGADVDAVVQAAHALSAEDARWIATIRDEDPREVAKSGSGEK